MVLMRRKDKRKGNADDELAVASDSSIVANKGVRSLAGARSGRFAADMRVQVGGYGRPDKTWGVDHPWHMTRENIMNEISSRDHMEEGFLVKEDEKKQGQGLSRAALKKKKKKAKLGGDANDATPSEAASAVSTEPAAQEDKPKPAATKQAKQANKPAKEAPPSEEQKTEAVETTTDGAAGKKRKRVNRNKKKQEKRRQDALSGDISDELGSDSEDEVEASKAKAKKQKKTQDTEAVESKPGKSPELTKAEKDADSKQRDAIAKQYESAVGQEFTTASGLTIRDVRIGQGRVPTVGEMLTVRYRGRIGDQSGIVFGKGMLTTNYGTGSVIAGWEEGMGTMRSGGIRFLTVPPELGYGESGKGGGKIPPNSTLFFEVELVRIGKRKRDAIGKDDVPLPSSFQRKRVPTGKKSGNNKNNTETKGKSKRSRRKYSV